MLASAEEIMELKKARHILERRMETVEKSQRPTVVRLSGQLGEIIEGIESAREKEKTMWNPAISTRIRLARKGMLFAKELSRFEMEVAGEFENGNISEDAGKRFVSIVKLIRGSKMQVVKEELGYFEEIAALGREYERTEEEMKEKDRVLKREQLRVEKILEEIAGLEKETIDLEKVRRYEELLESLEKLKALRATYIRSLVSKPVVELLGEIEVRSLKDYYPAFPSKEAATGLKQFFFEYPVFGSCSPGQLCEFFDYSEKKLSHICPETSKFRRVVMGNRNLFETIGALEQTSFLAVDDGDEKALDFYARKVEGAQGIVERIRELKKEKHADAEEYEKCRRIEKRKGELSKYRKAELEAKLEETRRLIGLLNSEATEPDSWGKQEPSAREGVGEREETAQKKESEGEGGLLSGIGKFLKKFARAP